jgi:lipopolysaccharide/colanic/teichoic acid biosynthesis glycosyltransferase
MACLLLLPVALVGMAVIAVAVVIDSPGPPFFVQERVGRNGRTFRMIKFRTLRHDYSDQTDREIMQAYIAGLAAQNGHTADQLLYKPLKSKDVTSLGRILRRTSLDELPQLINVLRGEMSLIGPRPNVLYEVEEYAPWHFERLEVLPGITGLAQVRGRSTLTFDDIVSYDIEYIRSQSLKLDLFVLWETVSTVLSSRGAG